ncbi:MAG: metalloprotease TldD, partial [Vicinamibacteria bacterium]|nr:metalloprotease TldD [Vicinamibacteria bacterium]
RQFARLAHRRRPARSDGATLAGNGPAILTSVTRAGHGLALDGVVGVCSKASRSIPVGVGIPTALVSEITVGGTRSS